MPTPTTPPEQPTHHHDADLDRGPHQPHRPPGPSYQPGHQPVPRAGAELGADVERAGQPVEHHPADQQPGARGRLVGRGEHPEHGVGDHPDHHHVGDRAEPGQLPDRHPQREHHHPDQDHHRAERQPGAGREPVVQHVPRVEAQAAADDHRHRGAVQGQPDRELHQPSREPAGPELGQRREDGELAASWCGERRHGPILGDLSTPAHPGLVAGPTRGTSRRGRRRARTRRRSPARSRRARPPGSRSRPTARPARGRPWCPAPPASRRC